MKKLFSLATLCCAFALASCNMPKDGDTEIVTEEYLGSYIGAYANPTDVELLAGKGEDKFFLSATFKRDLVRQLKEKDKEKFLQLSKYYKDDEYHNKWQVVYKYDSKVGAWLAPLTGLPPVVPTVLKDSIFSVSVVSNRSFGEAYPAGAELKDLITFHALSINDFIVSGYKPSKPTEPVKEWIKKGYFNAFSGSMIDNLMPFMLGRKNHFIPVSYPLNEVNQKNTRLISPSFLLVFKEHPLVGEHTFTVKVKFADKELTGTIKHLF